MKVICPTHGETTRYLHIGYEEKNEESGEFEEVMSHVTCFQCCIDKLEEIGLPNLELIEE